MKAWHITGYTFAADEYTPDEIEAWATSELRAEGVLPHEIERTAREGAAIAALNSDPGILAYRSENLLALLAEKRGIERFEESTFDSGDFPKVVFAV